jgi:hypothetical protein
VLRATLFSSTLTWSNTMTKLKLLSAAAILSAAVATPALAQEVIYNPGYCAQFYPNANCQNKGPNNPYTGSYQRRTVYQNNNGYWDNGWDNSWNSSWNNGWNDNRGYWPGDVAAGVVGGAVGTAGAIATAPFRGTRNDNSYAYMDDNASYCAQRYRSFDPASGTYLGRDGRRHACQ